uniref:Uncharacterized protein n=1 Tax=Sarcoptes scabiei TaxID=52283 RepID=A0A834VE30_SARSC
MAEITYTTEEPFFDTEFISTKLGLDGEFLRFYRIILFDIFHSGPDHFHHTILSTARELHQSSTNIDGQRGDRHHTMANSFFFHYLHKLRW